MKHLKYRNTPSSIRRYNTLYTFWRVAPSRLVAIVVSPVIHGVHPPTDYITCPPWHWPPLQFHSNKWLSLDKDQTTVARMIAAAAFIVRGTSVAAKIILFIMWEEVLTELPMADALLWKNMQFSRICKHCHQEPDSCFFYLKNLVFCHLFKINVFRFGYSYLIYLT